MYFEHAKKWIVLGVLLSCCVLLHFLSGNHYWVNTVYVGNIYPTISQFLRALFGRLPFSLGDIIYLFLVLYVLKKILAFIKRIFNKTSRIAYTQNWQNKLIKLLTVICTIYLVFNIFWGINYQRDSVAKTVGINLNPYNLEDLININSILVDKVNDAKNVLDSNKYIYPSSKILFEKTIDAYKSACTKYPFLTLKNKSIKNSFWGGLGNYMGFLGYYNPFTGEAQVNTTGPKFAQPYTACHEVAHQLGYAKEMEANFVGYLAAANSNDTAFHYAVYVDLFLYANRTLYFADTSAAKQYRKALNKNVIADLLARRKFDEAHTSFIEPITRYLYGIFLQSNEQPLGVLSYDEVTAFIIAFYKKNSFI
jgi:hypothetical protein